MKRFLSKRDTAFDAVVPLPLGLEMHLQISKRYGTAHYGIVRADGTFLLEVSGPGGATSKAETMALAQAKLPEALGGYAAHVIATAHPGSPELDALFALALGAFTPGFDMATFPASHPPVTTDAALAAQTLPAPWSLVSVGPVDMTKPNRYFARQRPVEVVATRPSTRTGDAPWCERRVAGATQATALASLTLECLVVFAGKDTYQNSDEALRSYAQQAQQQAERSMQMLTDLGLLDDDPQPSEATLAQRARTRSRIMDEMTANGMDPAEVQLFDAMLTSIAPMQRR